MLLTNNMDNTESGFDYDYNSFLSMEQIEEISRRYFEEFNTALTEDISTPTPISQSQTNALWTLPSLPAMLSLTNYAVNFKDKVMDKFTTQFERVSQTGVTNTLFERVSQTGATNTPAKPIDDGSIASSNIVSNLKTTIRDPLSIIAIAISCIIIYIYFANELIYQLLGLFYPNYRIYCLLHGTNQDNDKVDRIISVMKYFVIYAHLEFVSICTGLYFYHLKILVILFALYMLEYHHQWLSKVFATVIFYDKIVLGLLQSGLNKLYTEYIAIKNSLMESKKED